MKDRPLDNMFFSAADRRKVNYVITIASFLSLFELFQAAYFSIISAFARLAASSFSSVSSSATAPLVGSLVFGYLWE